MPDYGHVYADKKISEVNKQLKSTYRQAQREMKQKLKDFDARYADRSKQMKRMVAEGKISEQDYKDWLTGQVFVRQIWKSKIDQVNKILYDHNAQAMKLINNDKPSGNIEVKKAWLTEELAQGKTKVDYTIYGYALDSAPAAQPASEYSKDNSGTVVYLRFKNNGDVKLSKKFKAELNQYYTITFSGSAYPEPNGHGCNYNGGWRDYNLTKNGNNAEFTILIDSVLPNGTVTIETDFYNFNEYVTPLKAECRNSSGTTVTLFDEDASFGGNKTYPAVTVKQPTDADPVVTENLTVEKGNDDSWTGVLSGLPLTDENGKKIYYYVVEKTSNDYVPIDYSDNGFALEAKETKSVTVTNGPNNSPPSYELPESGGEGTAKYFVAGGALMLGAAMYYIIRKRKASA